MKFANTIVPLLLVVGSACGAAPPRRTAGSLTTYITQIVPLIIVGEGWSQRLVFQNVDDKWSSSGRISFYTKTGQPFSVDVQNRGSVATYDFTINQGKSLILDLVPKFSSQQLGWARIELRTTGTATGDYSGIGDLFGQVIFRKQSPGLPDLMCSMILGSYSYEKITTYFDNTGGNSTGMGILTSDTNSATSSVALRVTVRDVSGNVVSQRNIQQTHRTLYWMNLAADFPETNGRVGTFEVETVDPFSTSLTGFSLQFAGNGAFTVITPFEK